MTKKKGAKKRKLITKLTSPARLFRYNRAPQMVGDPFHNGNWERRCKIVYENEMIRKRTRERGGWTDEMWTQATSDNERYDRIWEIAFETEWFAPSDIGPRYRCTVDDWEWCHDEALRENAAFDLDRFAAEAEMAA